MLYVKYYFFRTRHFVWHGFHDFGNPWIVLRLIIIITTSTLNTNYITTYYIIFPIDSSSLVPLMLWSMRRIATRGNVTGNVTIICDDKRVYRYDNRNSLRWGVQKYVLQTTRLYYIHTYHCVCCSFMQNKQ